MSRPLLILGASARAAAFSASRAGFVVSALDLFADSDLKQCASTMLVEDYPRSFPEQAAQLPPMPWLYTGGLENHPEIVDRMASERRLFGNPGNVLRAVRDPFVLAERLAAAGIEFPETRRSVDGLPADGSWLAKSLSSSGGLGVAPWRGEVGPSASHCFQRRMPGEPHAAVMLVQDGRAQLLGLTRQLVGAGWCRAREFHYCGSIGPVSISEDIAAQLQRLGDVLACEFGLVGVFGVDCLIHEGRLTVIEINPRYPASAEVLERVAGRSIIAAHVAACDESATIIWPVQPSTRARSAGKCVLFAEREFAVTPELASSFDAANAQASDRFAPRVADIPGEGSAIHAGAPVVTLLDEGASEQEVLERLQTRAAEFYAATAAP